MDRAGHAGPGLASRARWSSRCATRSSAASTTSPQYVPDPPGGPIGFDEAVALALQRVRDGDVVDPLVLRVMPGAPSDPLPTDPDWAGGSLYTDQRERRSTPHREALWQVIEGIGGDNGWYSFPLAWAVRGWLDRLVGGVGLRRGRRDPDRLRVGESLDFWRVEEIEPGRLLRLRAEMRLPGLAWLEMGVRQRRRRTASTTAAGAVPPARAARPRLLVGVSPFHAVVFGGMARNIARAAETEA